MWLMTFIAIAILIAVVIISLYFFKFSDWNFIKYNFENNWIELLSNDKGEWGTFGDYVGGVLNPLFSLAALFAVLHTIQLQNKQISDTNKAIEMQQFETNFFQMLDLFDNVKREMSIIITAETTNGETKITDKRYKGMECITRLSNRMFTNFFRLQKDKVNIKRSYQEFYEIYHNLLRHYFRALYSVIKFIDDSNIKNKGFYSNIVCVNLSDSEVNLLFYYCYFLDIEENKELLKLVEKYDLLKYFTDTKKHLELL
jgi:hypothetical protein